MRIDVWGRATKVVLPAMLALAIAIMGFGMDASAQTSDARVRITHASPDAPAVDIWVDGSPAVTNVAFGQSTDLIPLPAGSYDVAVTPAGSTDPIADAVISTTLTLEAGAAYDVVAIGFLANISAGVYPLDLSQLPAGSTRLGVIHASPDAPAVDILADGSPLVEDLVFPEASGFLEVPGGSYDVQVAVSSSGAIAIDLPGTTLTAGQVYRVIAVGLVADGTLTVLPLAAPANAIHNLPDTGAGSAATTANLTLLALASGGFVLLFAAGAMRRNVPVSVPVKNR